MLKTCSKFTGAHPYQSAISIKFIYGKNQTENVQQELVPDPFVILVNNSKQPLHARNSFKNEIF